MRVGSSDSLEKRGAFFDRHFSQECSRPASGLSDALFSDTAGVCAQARLGPGTVRAGMETQRGVMLTWALLFIVTALLACLFGLPSVAGVAVMIGQALFMIFLFACLVSILFGHRRA